MEKLKNIILRSKIICKFLNNLNIHGKKSVTEKFFYQYLKLFKVLRLNGALEFFYAIEIIKPLMVPTASVKRGSTFYVSSMLSFEEQYKNAAKSLCKSILTREYSALKKICSEIVSVSFFFKSLALRQKKTNYKLIFKNRALTHFRWR